MSALFEELDYAPTPIGAISLRRRHILALKTDVFEILLGEEHLMSSLFTASEVALAELGLAATKGKTLDVLVGGLGLGYTAQAVLAHDDVASLTVVDLLEPVIRWHQEGLQRHFAPRICMRRSSRSSISWQGVLLLFGSRALRSRAHCVCSRETDQGFRVSGFQEAA